MIWSQWHASLTAWRALGLPRARADSPSCSPRGTSRRARDPISASSAQRARGVVRTLPHSERNRSPPRGPWVRWVWSRSRPQVSASVAASIRRASSLPAATPGRRLPRVSPYRAAVARISASRASRPARSQPASPRPPGEGRGPVAVVSWTWRLMATTSRSRLCRISATSPPRAIAVRKTAGVPRC